MESILRLLVGLGAAAFLGILVLLGVSLGGGLKGQRTAAPAPTATARPQPAPTALPSSAPSTPLPTVAAPSIAASCTSGGRCRQALLYLINTARARRGLPPLVLDRRQTYGAPRQGCVGTRGHAMAMAASGFVWKSNPRYPLASFPRDICHRVVHPAENVMRSRGAKWQAIRTMQRAMLAEGRRGKDYRHLMSRRYRRIGIDVERGGGYYYLTEDFLP